MALIKVHQISKDHFRRCPILPIIQRPILPINRPSPIVVCPRHTLKINNKAPALIPALISTKAELELDRGVTRLKQYMRDDLAKTAAGVGVELGVAAGVFSATLLELGSLTKLYSIDRWSDHHNEVEYQQVLSLLARFGARSEIIRKTFSDALSLFADDSLNFIYIDGYAHTGQEAGGTLRDWWPKVKHGGIFSGHDYTRRYPQTVSAVNAFAAEHNISISITSEDNFPSWIMVKP